MEPEIAAELSGGGFDSAGLAAGRGETMLVGHEPDFSNEIARLTGAKAKLRKGGLAIVDGNTLLALMRPEPIWPQSPARRPSRPVQRQTRQCPDRSWEVKQPGHAFRRSLSRRGVLSIRHLTLKTSEHRFDSRSNVTNTRHYVTDMCQ